MKTLTGALLGASVIVGWLPPESLRVVSLGLWLVVGISAAWVIWGWLGGGSGTGSEGPRAA